MDVAGGNEGMDAAMGGRGHRLGAGLDVTLGRPGQATDHRTIGRAHSLRNALNSREISWAGKGEAGFNDVHPQAGQLVGNRQLFLEIQAGTRRLLAIAQGGIEDQDTAGITGHSGASRRIDYELGPF